MYLLPPPSPLLHEIIVITDKYKKYFICPARIVDAEADDDYVYLYNKEAKKSTFCMSLKELMKFLNPLRAFCVVNKGKMVNIYEVNFQQTGNHFLQMSNARLVKPSERGNDKLWSMFLKIETDNLQYVMPFSAPEAVLTEP